MRRSIARALRGIARRLDPDYVGSATVHVAAIPDVQEFIARAERARERLRRIQVR